MSALDVMKAPLIGDEIVDVYYKYGSWLFLDIHIQKWTKGNCSSHTCPEHRFICQDVAKDLNYASRVLPPLGIRVDARIPAWARPEVEL